LGLSRNSMITSEIKERRIKDRARCYHIVDQLCDVSDVNRYIAGFL